MTFGNLREPGVALQGRVYRKADELLIVGHYDVTEFAWLNNELAQSNREVNTLHRALIQEKRRLADANEYLKVLNDQKNRFLIAGTAEHGGFQIVEDNFSGEAPKILQGVHDAPIEILFPLGQAELDVTEATETQHSHQHRYAA